MFAAGLGILLFSALPEVRAAKALADHGRPAVGAITAVFERRKAADRYAEYAYTVDGVAYKGRIDGYEGPYAAKGPVDLRFLPERPAYSSPDPAARLAKAERTIPLLGLWNAAILGVIVFIRGSARRARG